MKKRIQTIFLIGAMLCFLAAMIVPSFMPKDKGYQAVDSSGKVVEPPFRHHGTLNFSQAGTDSTLATIDIEIVEDTYYRTMGLMHRRSMDANRGMLFIFDHPDILSFWMKNTYIPLDLVYVNSAYQVVKICENTTPLTEEHYLSERPALYCVEVNAFFCREHGIQEGDLMQFERLKQPS